MAGENPPACPSVRRAGLLRSIARRLRSLCLRTVFHLRGGARYHQGRQYNRVLREALGQTDSQSDISDHLGTIFFFAASGNPALMVELGTRGGQSTRALLAAAAVTDACLLSIDIEDCQTIEVPHRDRWHFIQADDVAFGREQFAAWCRQHALEANIDVLFIDTSHEYEHTCREIETWLGHVQPGGVVMFHDTNMGKGIYVRHDGSAGLGWNNDRGVIRAIEEFLGRRYDENSFFCDVTDHFSIMHFPNSNGLTILKRRGR